jgi:acyl-CoA synthetase (AMP-forming)/AMP-acid ligase II
VNPHRIDVTSLGDLLLRAADRWPDNDAVVLPDGRRTFSELAARAYETARALIALGIEPGEHVGILMPNCLTFLDLLFGISLAGAIPVPLNGRYKARETGYVVENADLAALFTSDTISEFADFAAILDGAFADLKDQADPRRVTLAAAPKLRTLVMYGAAVPGFMDWREFEALKGCVSDDEVDRRRVAVALKDPCLMMYTSGTTANPKGCLLSHEAVVRNAFAMNREKYFFGPDDRCWDPLPMFHMAALLPMLTMFAGGAALLSMLHFEPRAALRMIEEERATAIFPLFPTVMTGLINHPDFSRRDLGRVRRVSNTGAPETLRQFQAAMPWAIHTSAYGMTENGGGMCMGSPSDTEEQRLATCGTPLTGMEIKVVDPETGAELPPGGKGELAVRGYSVFAGYYKDPVKSAEVLRNGWFHTGDLCSVDESGHVTCHGRIKDMLKVGGENVAAVEIEAFLMTHPAVKLAQVIGVPDARLQEVAAAFIELKPGASASEAEIIDFCRGRIASFKVPRHVRFVADWPMSASKVQKFRLREAFQAA